MYILGLTNKYIVFKLQIITQWLQLIAVLRAKINMKFEVV